MRERVLAHLKRDGLADVSNVPHSLALTYSSPSFVMEAGRSHMVARFRNRHDDWTRKHKEHLHAWIGMTVNTAFVTLGHIFQPRVYLATIFFGVNLMLLFKHHEIKGECWNITTEESYKLLLDTVESECELNTRGIGSPDIGAPALLECQHMGFWKGSKSRM
ncbi:hypothetical protein IFM89_029145 [Coptis chinensis]|uniref:Uncharacterized protein n=1 Tax=Coptis chinensis TaxID=261450 RepID=A0A835M7B3_9MAGN|nr:hypothetical protein IFM89_029145 [Coptis chinensis]